MLILITNDDGIHAEGIKALREALKVHYDIYMVAPEREMSASGHAITLHKPLRVIEVKMKDGSVSWAVNGTPADCVKIAFKAILPRKPDLVISGINWGGNLGNDVFYSGTVSAAMEGHFLGVPSIALSLAVDSEEADFSQAKKIIMELINRFADKIIKDKLFLNINIPYLPKGAIKGVRLTKLGHRNYINVFDQRIDPRGRKYYWMAGDIEDELGPPDSDTQAIREGYISITPLNLDLTNYAQLEDLKKFIK